MRYRTPIMERVPFIIRRPVVERQPVVTRISVFQRTPITSIDVPYNQCALCRGCTDCGGYEYSDQPMPDGTPRFGLVHYTGDQPVIEQLEHLENAGVYARLVADAPLDNETLFALAYSPYNVVQYNLSSQYTEAQWDASIYEAKKCGLYICLKVPVIVPTITKVNALLGFMERYHTVCRFFAVQFLNTHNVMPSRSSGFFNINGSLVPDKYFEPNDEGGIMVSQLFLTKFLTVLNQYIKPNKINVMICDNGNCY